MTDTWLETLRVLGHELRRPLTVIRGASTLLIDDAETAGTQTEETDDKTPDKAAADAEMQKAEFRMQKETAILNENLTSCRLSVFISHFAFIPCCP